MAELKTKESKSSVTIFLKSVDNDQRREDALAVLELMRKETGEEAKMWGSSIVGFGSYHYKYETGREGDWMMAGFSPRKQNLVLYIMPGFSNYDSLMAKLGKHKIGKSCLYINKLEDVHLPTLRKLVRESVNEMKKRYKS